MSAMYSFLFDRKSLALLICGFVVGGGLLFFSGVLVGVYWSLPYGTEIQATAPLPRPVPRPAPARVPSAAPPRVPEPAIELPSSPPPEAPAPVAPAEEAIGLPKAAPAAPAPAPAPPPRRSRPVPAPAPAPPVGFAEARYSVQVGAYSQLANSQATVAQLARRGYEPYVVEVQGARGVLHMVRLGRYPDRGAAARAASDFRKKERMEAIVAPLPRGEQGAPATSG